MDKRVGHGPLRRDQQNPPDERGVVDLADARVRIRSRAKPTTESLMHELDEIRSLLDQGLPTEAKDRLALLISNARNNSTVLALARCALSTALEQQGHYRDSLAAVSMYESPDTRPKLDEQTLCFLRVQIGLAYNYNGDHPKAIAMLKSILRDYAESGAANVGHIYAALSRTYRSINEYPIARDYAQRALEQFRQNGEWRGLAEAYFAVGVADLFEGHYEACLENLEQVLKLIGDRPAAYMLGRAYSNMAGACWFLKRPQEGIDYLKKAITYYERTDHKTNAADGYNNLGINLILIGQWERAQEALERAFSLATEVDERGAKVPMILDSLGELHMLRGDLDQAKDYLTRAVTLATENGNKWYAAQALRTLGRCFLVLEDPSSALGRAREALTLSETIGDRQGICESRLIAAEAHLSTGELDECSRELQRVSAETTDSPTDLAFTGEAHRLNGMLNMARNDAAAAAQHFGSSVSIFDMLGDRYRAARAHLELGRAYATILPDRAGEHLSRALNTFRELGARLDLSRAEEELRDISRSTPERIQEQSALTQLLTLRLAEAVASRELLLRELAAVMRQETGAQRVIITEEGERREPKVVVAMGCTPADSQKIAMDLDVVEDDASRDKYCRKHDAEVIILKSSNAPTAKLYLAPRNRAKLPKGVALEPLLRVVELGMDVCALRAGAQKSGASESTDELTGTSLMPGFIHSSPAMTQLVEEVHKIRSSDVTVLVTGESGTGKELVARAIHAISSRRAKVFVPFNCTAVPKELSEGYLWLPAWSVYRRDF
jgi:tetratricopeptide (TPR) repeat protein